MNVDNFVEKYKAEKSFCGCFIGNDDTLENAFDMLDNYIEYYKIPFKLEQVKTKFGGLRVYWGIYEEVDMKHYHFIEGAISMLENLWRDG